MKINRALNLVIPIDSEKGQLYVHSTPISREIFEQHFLVISKTFASIFSQGLGAICGSRIAYLMLKQTAEDMGIWNGVSGVKAGLVNEIIRLSNVVMPSSKGWKTIPLYTAIEKGNLDSETIAEIEGELIFFYLCVYDKQEEPNSVDYGHSKWLMGVANNIIRFYGVSEFLDDIDRGREFWRDGDHLISACLDHVAGVGFSKFLEDVDIEFKSSAHEFRQRHILRALQRNNGY